MSYEIELANMVHQTDVIAATMTDAFVTEDTIWPLILSESFPDTTNVIRFPKSGKVEAGALAESTAYTYAADDEITDTDTTVTGALKTQAQKITLHNIRFGGPFNSIQRSTREAAKALNRLAAADLKALFSSVSNSVTATNTLVKDNLLDARYNIVSNVKTGAVGEQLVGMFDHKGMNELAKVLTDTTATAFTNQVDLGVLGMAGRGGAKGELFDIFLFETDGLPTDSGDDVACVWDPHLAFCAGVDGNNGFDVYATPPSSQTPWLELFFTTFWHIAENNDTAACQVKSDT